MLKKANKPQQPQWCESAAVFGATEQTCDYTSGLGSGDSKSVDSGSCCLVSWWRE